MLGINAERGKFRTRIVAADGVRVKSDPHPLDRPSMRERPVAICSFRP